MTRGKIIAILDGYMLITPEYNGDMYMFSGGHGKRIIKDLNNDVHTEEDFYNFFEEFTEDYYGSTVEEIQDEAENFRMDKKEITDDLLDMRGEDTIYIHKWFSDYLYIKNLSNHVISIKTNDGNVIMEHASIVGLDFGQLNKDSRKYSINIKLVDAETEEVRETINPTATVHSITKDEIQNCQKAVDDIILKTSDVLQEVTKLKRYIESLK